MRSRDEAVRAQTPRVEPSRLPHEGQLAALSTGLPSATMHQAQPSVEAMGRLRSTIQGVIVMSCGVLRSWSSLLEARDERARSRTASRWCVRDASVIYCQGL